MWNLILNSGYFSLVNAANLLIPFLTIPIIVAALGIEKYGVITILAAQFSVLVSVVDFGFNVSAIQRTAPHVQDRKLISRTVCGVTHIRLFIGCVILLFSSTLIVFKSIQIDTYFLLILFNMSLLPQALNFVWVFQLLRKIKEFVLISFLSRLIYLLMIVGLVVDGDDLMWIPLANFTSSMCLGLISLFYLKKHDVRFNFGHNTNFYVLMIREAFPYFLTNIMTGFYLKLPIFMISYFSSTTVVAQYSIAEKIIHAIKTMISSINQASIAEFSQKIKLDKKSGFKILRTGAYISILPIFVSAIVVHFFIQDILEFMIDDEVASSAQYIKVLIFTVPITFLSYISCIILLGGIGAKFELTIIYLSALIIGTLSLIVTITLFGVSYVPYNVVLVEVFVLISSVLVYRSSINYTKA